MEDLGDAKEKIGMLIVIILLLIGLGAMYGAAYLFVYRYSQTLPDEKREEFWENFERNLLNHENL